MDNTRLLHSKSQLRPLEGNFLSKERALNRLRKGAFWGHATRGHTKAPSAHTIITGSLALRLQNSSGLCCLDLSLWGKSKELRQLSRSEELPCGMVMYLCGPVLFFLIEWLRTIVCEESVLTKDYCDWGLFFAAYCCIFVKACVSIMSQGLNKANKKGSNWGWKVSSGLRCVHTSQELFSFDSKEVYAGIQLCIGVVCKKTYL